MNFVRAANAGGAKRRPTCVFRQAQICDHLCVVGHDTQSHKFRDSQ